MGMAESGGALYLFSSNSRPLYAQDVLNILAAPKGLSYAFRYRRAWVAHDLRERWGANELLGGRAILHFSLQQPNQFLSTTLIPLRIGVIDQTSVEAGDIYLVQFSIGSDVTLAASAALEDTVPESREDARAIAAYRAHLERLSVAMPPEAWAGHGPDVTRNPEGPLVLANDEGAAFARTVRLLGGTSTYERARFFRFSTIAASPADKDAKAPSFDPKEGYLLRPARAYQVMLLQSQPGDVSSAAGFAVDVSENVARFVGQRRFEISSKYDVITMPLIAADLGSEVQRRSGVIDIAPEPEIYGPRLSVPVTVEMQPIRKATAAVAAVAAVTCAALASMVGTLNLLSVGLVLAAAMLSTWLGIRVGGKIPLVG